MGEKKRRKKGKKTERFFFAFNGIIYGGDRFPLFCSPPPSQEDVFMVKAVDLGKLVKVKIRHDNQGIGSAWFLDRIEVEDGKRKKR